jgi:hypothetical protein
MPLPHPAKTPAITTTTTTAMTGTTITTIPPAAAVSTLADTVDTAADLMAAVAGMAGISHRILPSPFPRFAKPLALVFSRITHHASRITHQ